MRRRRTPGPVAATLHYKITSILLQYPDERVHAALDDVAAALPAIGSTDTRELLGEFVGWLRTTPPTDAAQHYVSTFDHNRKRALYLTYYRHGDTRARGMALLTLKHTYRSAGYSPPEHELPDYLPLILEFAAFAPEPGGRVLTQCRAGLEMLREAVHDVGSSYATLLDALCSQLPELRSRERDNLRKLAQEGPPTEQVGLEPFAPPEYLTGQHR
ncbi:MAG: nitrate reductase molybdenum cofactor assembly chaperone [Pseudonocardiaceae bacterium]